MKKFVSGLLAMMLACGVGATAYAASPEVGPEINNGPATLTKVYTLTGDSTAKSPAETFTFTIKANKSGDPLPTLSQQMPHFDAEAATSAGAEKTFTLTFPQYTRVGVYEYTISETDGKTAGVTYHAPMTLKVTVTQEGDNLVYHPALYVTTGTKSEDGKVPNSYSAGKLTVTKYVSGNMGDRHADFNVTVNFKAPAGKTVRSVVSYVDSGVTKTIPVSDWEDGTASAVITLKHDESVTFTNLPYGVTYTVQEQDYTGSNGGYDAANYQYGDTNKTIDTAEDTVAVYNNKESVIDTGIVIDNLPYIVLLAFVAVGAFAMKKRSTREN